MPGRNGDYNASANNLSETSCLSQDHTQNKFNDYPIHHSTQQSPFSNCMLGDLRTPKHSIHHNIAGLLPPINLGSEFNGFSNSSKKPITAGSCNESGSSSSFELQTESQTRSWELDPVAEQDATDPAGFTSKSSQEGLGSNRVLSQPRSLHKTSASRELRWQAGWPGTGAHQPLIAKTEYGFISPPETGRIQCERPVTPITFSPDTPPETPDVANRSQVDDNPTSANVKARGIGSLDTKICSPITPPNSRIPTPFDRITSSTCFLKPSCRAAPAMTQLDPSTATIVEDLEVMLADFPITTLRLNTAVVRRIRSVIPSRSTSRTSTQHRSSTAPHSRYSPYRPLSSHPTSPWSPPHANPTTDMNPSRNPSADPTTFALRTIFPTARPHHLDSLQATYLALHYIINIPATEFSAASSSETAASPFTTAVMHSRSSSVVSNVPPKARAMLGLDSPLRSPTTSPTRSWFRASSPELDMDVKTRLENVRLLLEASVKKLLGEIEGRPLGKADDALMRAVGEVVRMGERRSSAQAT
ncbi:MAG: hypothetical protein Q9218_006645 [Villophora microphyllina]